MAVASIRVSSVQLTASSGATSAFYSGAAAAATRARERRRSDRLREERRRTALHQRTSFQLNEGGEEGLFLLHMYIIKHRKSFTALIGLFYARQCERPLASMWNSLKRDQTTLMPPRPKTACQLPRNCCTFSFDWSTNRLTCAQVKIRLFRSYCSSLYGCEVNWLCPADRQVLTARPRRYYAAVVCRHPFTNANNFRMLTLVAMALLSWRHAQPDVQGGPVKVRPT